VAPRRFIGAGFLSGVSAVIKRGDVVRIKPEWQDPGDEKFTWIALEDESNGRVRIHPEGTGIRFPVNQIVETRMLEER
jgi:hypothetical protein